MATTRPRAAQRRRCRLVLGQHLGLDLVDAELRGDGLAVVPLSPVSMTMRMPSARSALERSGVVALTGSAMATKPASLAVDATKMTVAPAARAVGAARAAAVSMPCSARNLALPRRRAALDGADDALADGASRSRSPATWHERAVGVRHRDDGSASGCSLARSTRRPGEAARPCRSRPPVRWRPPSDALR
jgi:hypothetical protein